MNIIIYSANLYPVDINARQRAGGCVTLVAKDLLGCEHNCAFGKGFPQADTVNSVKALYTLHMDSNDPLGTGWKS